MSDPFGRRDFMQKAVVAGSIAWSAPIILTLDSKAAASFGHSHPPPTTPFETNQGPPAAVAKPVSPEFTGRVTLPFTGDNQRDEVVAGAVAAALGAVVVVASHEPRTL